MLQFALRAAARLVENTQRGTLKEIVDFQHKKEQQERIDRQQQERTLVLENDHDDQGKKEEEEKANDHVVEQVEQHVEEQDEEEAPTPSQEQQERHQKVQEFLSSITPEVFTVAPWSATHLFDILKTDKYFDQQLFILPLSQDLEQEGPFAIGSGFLSSSSSGSLSGENSANVEPHLLPHEMRTPMMMNNNNSGQQFPYQQWKRLCVIFGNGNIMLSPSTSPTQSLATDREALAFCLQILLAENNKVILSEVEEEETAATKQNKNTKENNTTSKKNDKTKTLLRTIKKRREIFLFRGKEFVSYLLDVFGSDLVNHLGGFAENVFDLGVCHSVLQKGGISTSSSTTSSSSSFDSPMNSFGALVESCFPSAVTFHHQNTQNDNNDGDNNTNDAEKQQEQETEEQHQQKNVTNNKDSAEKINKEQQQQPIIHPHDTILSCVSLASTLCYRTDQHYSQPFFYSILCVLLLRAVSRNRLDLCHQFQVGGGRAAAATATAAMMNNNINTDINISNINNNNRGLDYTVKLLTRTEYYCALMTHHGVPLHRGKLTQFLEKKWKDLVLTRYQLFLVSEALMNFCVERERHQQQNQANRAEDAAAVSEKKENNNQQEQQQQSPSWPETLLGFQVLNPKLFDDSLDDMLSDQNVSEDSSSSSSTNNNNNDMIELAQLRRKIFEGNKDRDVLSLIATQEIWNELVSPALRRLVLDIERYIRKLANGETLMNTTVTTPINVDANDDDAATAKSSSSSSTTTEYFLPFAPTLISFIKKYLQNILLAQDNQNSSSSSARSTTTSSNNVRSQEVFRDCCHNADLAMIFSQVSEHLLSNQKENPKKLSDIDLGLASIFMITTILAKMSTMIFEVRSANQLESHRYVSREALRNAFLVKNNTNTHSFDPISGKVFLPPAFRCPPSIVAAMNQENNNNNNNNTNTSTCNNSIVDQIHSEFTCIKADTARIFSSNPSVQTIPRTDKSTLRNCLTTTTAQTNHTKFVSLDYSQFELRVLAHLSGDENLIRMFKENKDVISEVSNEIVVLLTKQPANSSKSTNKKNQNQQQLAQLSVAVRTVTKIIIYGILFGIGDDALAVRCREQLEEMRSFQQQQERQEHAKNTAANNNNMNDVNNVATVTSAVSTAESINPQHVRALFHRKFPRVRQWMNEVSITARTDESVTTLSGFTRRFNQHLSSSSSATSSSTTSTSTTKKTLFFQHQKNQANTFNAISRQSVATIVQGTAADLLKVAMDRIFARAVVERGRNKISPIADFYLIMAVHDELVFVVDTNNNNEDENEEAKSIRLNNTINMLKEAMTEAGDVLIHERFGLAASGSSTFLEQRKIVVRSSSNKNNNNSEQDNSNKNNSNNSMMLTPRNVFFMSSSQRNTADDENDFADEVVLSSLPNFSDEFKFAVPLQVKAKVGDSLGDLMDY